MIELAEWDLSHWDVKPETIDVMTKLLKPIIKESQHPYMCLKEVVD